MQALVVIDAQNEFSDKGKRPVPNFLHAAGIISKHVEKARREHRPIAWVRHHNRPDESPAFVPGSWGAEFHQGFGPKSGAVLEKEFQKNVYGAFTGTEIGPWLEVVGSAEILIVGFYTHGCVSTTAREAIMRGLSVWIDPEGTGACDMSHRALGTLTAHEVRRSALLHLAGMGVSIFPG